MEGAKANSKARLMISNMELENFKSYAGCQTIGPFHKRFSSIVGPNGSGKSNVIDALLFVFGKRAKQLRLNKVSELIHKSSGFPNLEYARVAVYFQLIIDDEESEDNYEVVPGSEFVVTRTAYLNNQSKYTIDGKTTTYNEVGQLLRGHGIDLDNNRFLILQGEVEQIAMMKPKGQTPQDEGLLEYLEDIIGSNRFVERIDAASKSLDEINEQRVEKVNRLKVAEKERDNLSGSKLEAEAFIEKEKDIRRKKNALFQVMEHAAIASLAEVTAKQESVTEKLRAERAKHADTEKRLAVIQAEYEKVKSEHDKVAAELEKSTMQYDAFERNDVKLQEDMKHAKANIKKQQTAIAKEQKREEECLKEATETKAQMAKYEALIADFQGKKVEEEAALEKIMEGLQEATAELRVSLEAAQAKLMVQEKAVASLQTEKESVETAVTLLQTRANTAAKNRAAAEDRLNKLRADREALTSSVTDMDGPRRASLTKSVTAAEQAIAAATADESRLQEAVRQAVTEAEIGKAALATQQSRSGSNGVVQKLLQAAKRSGPLAGAGVRGRLGDLASIAPEYDVAISTACGMLDHIVVDTADGAQACINHLREANLGRASFIALDQIGESAARMTASVRLPAGASRLFDLIQVSDEALRPAFFLALAHTLVATDLDQAVKIAYEGDRAVWRVVTLDGNLIDTSGAMSGGGNQQRSGAMKLTSGAGGKAGKTNTVAADAEEEYTPARIQQLESRVTSLQAELSSCRARKAAAEAQLVDVKKQLKELHMELEKARMALSRFGEQESDLVQRIAQISQECELSADEQAEVKRNQQRLEEIEAQIGTVSPNFRTMQAEVASLQRQILSVGGPKLTKVQQKIDSLTAQIEQFSSNLSTKAVEETNSRKQCDKAAAARTKAEQELARSETKLSELVAQQKQMEIDAMEVVNAVEAAKARLAGLETQLQTSSKEYHDLKNLVGKFKAVEIDLGEELGRFAAEIKECKATAKKWGQEAEGVRKQHIDEQKEFLSVVRSVAPVIRPVAVASANTDNAPGSPMKVCAAGDESVPVAEEEDELEHLPIYTPEEVQRFDTEELKRDINALEIQKNKMKNSVNMSALLEYMKKDANYRSRLYELEQITEARNAVRREYEDLRRQRLEEFMAGFGVISLKLKEMYQMITLGGDAELELLDSLDPFSEGIVFSVRPPRKSWKNISNLSGGEKTLSSLALVFALHHYKPTPLYVMDEIDAALDFKNVSIVANYIKDRTKNAQFVIISLRNNMFELADRLVGIYKTNDATKSVTINPKLFENATAGKAPQVSAVKSGASRGAAMPLSDVTNTV